MTSTVPAPARGATAAPAVPATPADAEWLTCGGCRVLLYRKRFDRLLGVCPECGWHSRLTVDERLRSLLDPDSVRPVTPAESVHDPLNFTDLVDYPGRLSRARESTGLADAVRVVRGRIQGHPVVVAVMDFRFLGGSLGVAAGEAVTAAAEAALADSCALLIVTASGGARMQEGALALMQMAKTGNALRALDEAGLLTITLVTDPTYGGVAASFATLTDVIIAEPGARMGFAGPRVIAQTIRQELPPGFQTAEFLLERGLVDGVRARGELPWVLGQLLAAAAPAPADWGGAAVDPVLRDPAALVRRPPAEVVRLARHLDRPTLTDHLTEWLDGFVELRGARDGAGDCRAVVGGLGVLDGLPVLVIGHQKGHRTEELVRHSFGMPSPAGYRKAARLMRLAAKLRVPIVTLVDTAGAHPGLAAEEQGQAVAIAESIALMGSLPVPVVTVITGEGGSGGALALAVADRVLLTENGTYSVISPEGCAAILWRSPERAADAAAALGVDAGSLLRLGVVDGVVPEPPGGAHLDPARASRLVRDAVVVALRELRTSDGPTLVARRRARFRRFGLTNDRRP
ncbi:acetyl-CoA carboxylase carboxyltransferase subunit alpha/beta [Micromonospora sp. 4G57]|uniref:Multifunctional fusion protein n=1 Tax=Micromonospora sicca TaxID=2202420 RepID=A0ABU5JKT5_9ACTN|nr:MULTISPECIES: acetyl-CoA carboxylase carboxyltransferase subunit alpha/beta [unclassified Micromonospora]MDZ5443319.1 acetyl-CoA carboxylase carboxyltransferase subunit alpha/beta [Micromonospora sp. 4G57]MDZ5493186.1 acetyl-CoA carboxylase carboxyltransferase subunit alpha/beta [Micromonospora sp. 4G53]